MSLEIEDKISQYELENRHLRQEIASLRLL